MGKRSPNRRSDEGSIHGALRDPVIIKSDPDAQAILYWDVVDLIEFPTARKRLWMMVGYYRHAGGRPFWGEPHHVDGSPARLTTPLQGGQEEAMVRFTGDLTPRPRRPLDRDCGDQAETSARETSGFASRSW